MSPEVRELRLLEELDRGGHVSQRRLAERVGVSVGLVNQMLRELMAVGYVRVARDEVRPYAYALTARGSRRQNEVLVWHL